MGPSFFSTAGVARASARHPWRTIGLWVLMIVIAGVLASGIGATMNNSNDFTSNLDSKKGETLIDQRIGKEPLSEPS